MNKKSYRVPTEDYFHEETILRLRLLQGLSERHLHRVHDVTLACKL